MNTPDEILDPDLENGLLLKQIEDDPINDADIDEVALLESDQLEWEHNWGYPNMLQTMHKIQLHRTTST